MPFSITRAATLATALFGALQASAAPARTRAPLGVVTECSVPNTVAITFDDGPYQWTKALVDLLDNNGAKGTFFVNGDNYGCIYNEANADNVKYAYDHGHQIASHTWRHANLTTLSGDELRDQFTKTNDAIQKITGAVPAFMRPPYGEYNDEVVEVAGSLGQTVTIWDLDSGDSSGVPPSESKERYDAKIADHPSTILTLNHETHESTYNDVIPYILQRFQESGYDMVTVAQCLGQEPYQSAGDPATRDSSWQC